MYFHRKSKDLLSFIWRKKWPSAEAQSMKNTFQSHGCPNFVLQVSKNTYWFSIDVLRTKQDNKYIKESARAVLSDITNKWDEIYNTPFTKVLTKLPETNLQEKPEVNKKRNMRKLYRNIKTTRSMDKATYTNVRSSLYFEPKQDTLSRKKNRFTVIFYWKKSL